MPRPLTFKERFAVSLAFKGERFTHRRWPREVVEAIVKADVVRTSGSQYVPPRRVFKILLPAVASLLPRRVIALYSGKW